MCMGGVECLLGLVKHSNSGKKFARPWTYLTSRNATFQLQHAAFFVRHDAQPASSGFSNPVGRHQLMKGAQVK